MNEGKVESPLFNPQSAIRNPKSSLRSGLRLPAHFSQAPQSLRGGGPGATQRGQEYAGQCPGRREVSIVHAQPGTTRDWVRELALIGGMPIYLTDTAGLWEESSDIDAQAMQRARAVANAADLVLLTGAGELRISDFGFRIAENVLRLRTKCDIYGADPEIGVPRFDVAVSAHTEQGMEELKAAILRAGTGGHRFRRRRWPSRNGKRNCCARRRNIPTGPPASCDSCWGMILTQILHPGNPIIPVNREGRNAHE